MKLFSRIVMITNICFYISIIMRLITITDHNKAVNTSVPAAMNPAVATLVILGFIAIFLNVFYTVLFLIKYSRIRFGGTPRFIALFNLVTVPVQIIYYFFSR